MRNVHIHATRAFAAAFRNQLAQGPSEITIVSPFLTPVKPWASLLAFSKHVIGRGTEKLEIITRPPIAAKGAAGSDNQITYAEAELIEAEGVSLKIRDNNLHAKVFYFAFEEPKRYVAYLGSSNFTLGGFERNEETMVEIAHPDDHQTVQAALKQLSSLGSFPYYAWKSRRLQTRN